MGSPTVQLGGIASLVLVDVVEAVKDEQMNWSEEWL